VLAASSETLLFGLAGGLLVFVLVVMSTVVRWRRGIARRIAALSARVGDEDLKLEGTGMEAALARLERLVDGVVSAGGDAAVGRNRAELVLGRLAVGVMVVDDQGEISYRNPRAAELLNGEVEGAPAHGVVEELLISAVEGRSLKKRYEITGPRPRTIEVTSTPLEDRQRTIGGMAMIEDVSDDQRLELARQAFVADLGQELRVPVGALGLLAETLAGEADPVLVQRLARRLQAESHRLGRVIDDLVSLARIETDESLPRQSVAVHLVVAQAAERVRGSAQEKAITINFSESPRRLAVLGDRRQLVSAVFNLLDNAVKFSPEGSVVEVRARLDDEWVELMVRDKGIGIPERDLDRIFDRFYRGDRQRSLDRGSGSGLGLAVVRHVAITHHGDVRVESREGQGSTFTLRVLSAPAPVPELGPALSLEAAG
jgi:two-component system sensor histidine kinase SenX3